MSRAAQRGLAGVGLLTATLVLVLPATAALAGPSGCPNEHSSQANCAGSPSSSTSSTPGNSGTTPAANGSGNGNSQAPPASTPPVSTPVGKGGGGSPDVTPPSPPVTPNGNAGGGENNSKSTSNGGQIPPGNNGHIQIDEYAADGGKGNDPHPGCGFSINFFGYDTSTVANPVTAHITVAPWAPTKGGTIQHFTTSFPPYVRASGSQLDENFPTMDPAQVVSMFSGVAPKKQGWHVRVTVTVQPLAIGSDVKHHMLWLNCAGVIILGSGGSTGSGPGAGPTSTPGAPGTPGTTGGSSGSGSGGVTLVGAGTGVTPTPTPTVSTGGSSGSGGSSGVGGSWGSGGSSGVGGSWGSGGLAARAVSVALAPFGGLHTQVLSATTVHTGEVWAGSRPLELAGFAAGTGMILWGGVVRRRVRRRPKVS